MLEIIQGDLLDFPKDINVLAHSCNTRNVMGGGIARQIKERYPEAFDADSKAYFNSENKLGEFSFCKLRQDNNKRIINLYTQEDFGQGRQVDYESFFRSITYLKEAIVCSKDAEKYVLGFPFGISCGLAGGSWNIIFSMLNEVFSGAVFTTLIVKKDHIYHA